MVLVLVFALAGAFMLWERRRPGTVLPAVRGWHGRALLLNLTQLGAVVVAGLTWDRWLARASLWSLDGHLGVIGGGVVGYVVLTFVYYWWHRARHASPTLWRLFHQVHHSPARLEVITAFYKHPAEQIANTVLSAVVVFLVLGLSPAAAAVTTVLCAASEFVYHVNASTPRWLGWFIQRPEMHRIHHERGAHRSNYGDLPLWDMLFGTYDNPPRFEGPCGFADEEERRLGAMLAFRPVEDSPASSGRFAYGLLLAIGLSAPVGSTLGLVAPSTGQALAAPGKALLVSPAPKVFCRLEDMEPFAYEHRITLRYRDGEVASVVLDRERYRRLAGPYALRNVYGAALAFAPLLRDETRQAVMQHGVCRDGELLALIDRDDRPVAVTITSTPRDGAMGRPHRWEVACD